MKILLLDIETAPNEVYTWGLWKQNISINQIRKPGYTLCYAYKWLGKSRTHFMGLDRHTPRQILKHINELLEEADAVIHYNGTNFDIPVLNRELLQLGFDRPAPFAEIDLLQTVRAKFKFESNKLDFVCQQLGLGSKVVHKGMELWDGCMKGDAASWRIMRSYNIQDVKLLETLYLQLLPWITNHPNHGLYVDDKEPVCIKCGSKHIGPRGFYKTKTGIYQRYKCKDCHSWQRGRYTVVPRDKRKSIFVGVN